MATPTSAKQWKKNTSEELKLPSGNTCLIKRPGMEKLLAAGVLPDELTKIAIDQIDKVQAGPRDHLPKAGPDKGDQMDPETLKKFMEGENAVQDLFSTFDRVTAMCVIQPECRWHMRKVLDGSGHQVTDAKGKALFEEIPESERDEDTLYTDEVDIDDKTFIFNFVVGGTRDLETFRTEFGDALADVQSGSDVEVPSERTDGDRE